MLDLVFQNELPADTQKARECQSSSNVTEMKFQLCWFYKSLTYNRLYVAREGTLKGQAQLSIKVLGPRAIAAQTKEIKAGKDGMFVPGLKLHLFMFFLRRSV